MGSIFGGSTFTSAPFLMGVMGGLLGTGATGETEAGGVTDGGFFSFFGVFGALRGGESAPDD